MSTTDIGGAKPYASLTSKELVLACMDVEEASEEKGFLGLNVKGFRISCPCCDYCKFASTKQGFTNNANHFRSCTKEEGEREIREMLGVSKYANLNFIMGSAAVVEQLWSKSDCVYTKRRAGLSPLVFEMIMFLKENRDLWSVYDVAEANDRRKTKNRKSRAQQRIAKNAIVEALAVPYVAPKKS